MKTLHHNTATMVVLLLLREKGMEMLFGEMAQNVD